MPCARIVLENPSYGVARLRTYVPLTKSVINMTKLYVTVSESPRNVASEDSRVPRRSRLSLDAAIRASRAPVSRLSVYYK